MFQVSIEMGSTCACMYSLHSCEVWRKRHSIITYKQTFLPLLEQNIGQMWIGSQNVLWESLVTSENHSRYLPIFPADNLTNSLLSQTVRLCDSEKLHQVKELVTVKPYVSMLNIKVHDISIQKKMNRHGLFERVVGEKYCFSKKQKWLMFAKLHLHQSQDFWNNVFWTDETIMPCLAKSK